MKWSLFCCYLFLEAPFFLCTQTFGTPLYNLLICQHETDSENENTGTDRDVFGACGPHHSVDMVPPTTAGMLGLRGYLVDTIEEVGARQIVTYVYATTSRLAESIEFFAKLDRLQS